MSDSRMAAVYFVRRHFYHIEYQERRHLDADWQHRVPNRVHGFPGAVAQVEKPGMITTASAPTLDIKE